MLKTEKKELLERLSQSGLLYEVLTLSGREIIIHEATGHSARKVGEMAVAIENDKKLSEDVKSAIFTLYLPLSCLSAGDVPQTPDEFFWMKNSDIEEWTTKARTMNPQFFTLLDTQEKIRDLYLSEIEKAKSLLSEAEKAKKKKRRSTSKLPS